MTYLKSFCLLVLLLVCGIHIDAQYSVFFSEDFASNANGWKVSTKKNPCLEVSSGMYRISNVKGKNPIASVIKIPFQDKNYRIEAEINQRNSKASDGSHHGIVFGAADDKNGYAFVLQKPQGFKLLQFIEGQVFILAEGGSSPGDATLPATESHRISIRLENLSWYFTVNEVLVYRCSPLPWMGNHVGFYVSAGSGLEVRNGLFIAEAPIPANPCPLPFTQHHFDEQFGKILCAASEDFVPIQGECDQSNSKITFWKLKDVSLNGATDMFIALDSANVSGKGKDVVVMLSCPDALDIERALALFENLRVALNSLTLECMTIKANDPLERVLESLLKAAIWEGEINKQKVRVELDLIRFGEEYYSIIHINTPGN